MYIKTLSMVSFPSFLLLFRLNPCNICNTGVIPKTCNLQSSLSTDLPRRVDAHLEPVIKTFQNAEKKGKLATAAGRKGTAEKNV